MNISLRDYAFLLIALFLTTHGLNIIIIEFHSERIDTLLFRCISSNVFLAIDILSIISIGFLLYGLLTFSHTVVLGWFIYLTIAWHFPFALIVVNGIMVKYKEFTSANYFIGTLIPALQLCVWSLIMIHIFRYWCILKEFEKLPEYLRVDPTLLVNSHHRYNTDKLRKTILEKRQIITYHYRI